MRYSSTAAKAASSGTTGADEPEGEAALGDTDPARDGSRPGQQRDADVHQQQLVQADGVAEGPREGAEGGGEQHLGAEAAAEQQRQAPQRSQAPHGGDGFGEQAAGPPAARSAATAAPPARCRRPPRRARRRAPAAARPPRRRRASSCEVEGGRCEQHQARQHHRLHHEAGRSRRRRPPRWPSPAARRGAGRTGCSRPPGPPHWGRDVDVRHRQLQGVDGAERRGARATPRASTPPG